MITKLFNFFQLYFVMYDGVIYRSIEPVLYTSLILYFADFYHMVKRKSLQETLALLCIPTLASLLLAFFSTMFVRVPKPGELDVFLKALSDPKLPLYLLLLLVLYGLLWLFSFIFNKKQGRRRTLLGTLSCIPDYIFCLGIVAGFLGGLVMGTNFWTAYGQRITWLYLYCIYFLTCKILLLIVFMLISLYSVKLPFRWKEGQNPVSFLSRYFLFYQNSMARNSLLFCLIALLCVFVPMILYEDETSFLELLFIIFIFGSCLLIIFLFSINSVRVGLRQFLRWGNEYRIKELFCREYFTQEPLYRDSQYTVTRHFLIAEQYPALVYFWGELCRVSDMHIDKEETCAQLSFDDGRTCRMSLKEAFDSKPVFEYAQSILENGIDLKEEWLLQQPVVVPEDDTAARKRKLSAKILLAAVLLLLIFLGTAYDFYRQSDLYAYRQEMKMAEQFYEDGSYRNAMTHYKEALSLKPDSVKAEDGYFYSVLALARENLSLGNSSDSLYSWLIQKRPGESYLYVEAAQVYLISTDYTKALDILRKGYKKTQDSSLLEKEDYVREHIIPVFQKKTQLQRPTIVYTYDHNGNILTEDEYYHSTSGDSCSSVHYTYDENGRLTKKYTFYNYFGSSEETHEYFYDSNDREWARVTWHDAGMDWLWSCRYLSYDEKGRLTQVEYSDGNDDAPQAFVTAKRRLDELHLYEEQEDGSLFEVIIVLNPLAEYSLYSDEPYIYRIQVNQYDSAGNHIEEDKYIKRRYEDAVDEDSIWKITAMQAQGLNARGWLNILEALELDLNDESCDTSLLKKSWEYDSNGNKIFYDNDLGIPTLYEYDEDQHLIVETILNQSGKPALTYRHEYNELGQRIKTKIKDETGDTTGYRYINYEYQYAYTGEPLWEAAKD